MGARRWPARSTASTMRPNAVSGPIPVMRTSSAPDWLMVPAKTWAPGSFSTGMDSPVMAAWSTKECPPATMPSTGTRAPVQVRTTNKLRIPPARAAATLNGRGLRTSSDNHPPEVWIAGAIDERVVAFDDLEARRAESGFALQRRNLVLAGSGRSRGPRPAIDHDEAPAGAQRVSDVPEHRRRVVELVVRVEDEHRVDAVSRQAGGVRAPMDHEHIVDLARPRPDANDEEWQLADIDSEHAPARADARRELEREVTRAAAKIGDQAAVVEIECAKDVCRSLPAVALTFHDLQALQRRDEILPDVEQAGDRESPGHEAYDAQAIPTRERRFRFRHGEVLAE